jgi:hypothetical protein
MPDEDRTPDAAVQRLYDVFAAQPRGGPLGFCPHCVLPDEAEALAATPLRELGADLLGLFLTNALSWTWGEPDDLWYYLPRIFELAAAGELGTGEIHALLTSGVSVLRDWPQDQRDAVAGFLTALLATASTPDAVADLSSALSALSG